MGSRKNYLCMGSAKTNPFWELDEIRNVHMLFRLELDHEIDGALLQEAYEKTLDVWPMLKHAFVLEEDGNLYFAEDPEPLRVHHSPRVVAPGHGLNADRLLAVTYDGNMVSFSGMHAYFDGGSVLMLIRGILCRYLALYYKNDAYADGLPTAKQGDQPRNYGFYAADSQIAAMAFERKEAVLPPKRCIAPQEPDFSPGHRTSLCELFIPSEQFLAYCKSNSASPSIMLFLLFAKAAYELNPNAAEPVMANNTMNLRGLLGMENAIMGQSMGSFLWTDRKELAGETLSSLAVQQKALMNEQRDRDYVLSRIDEMRTGTGQAVCEPTVTLAYMGKLDYGACTSHIRAVSACIDVCACVHMLALHDGFYIDFQLGEKSREYAEAVGAMLKREGVSAEITKSIEALPEEIRE